jgi:hypothetical protein
MPSSDRTADFRKFIHEKQFTIPDAKRRKLSKPTWNDPSLDGQVNFGKEYMSEAYVIVSYWCNWSDLNQVHLNLTS